MMSRSRPVTIPALPDRPELAAPESGIGQVYRIWKTALDAYPEPTEMVLAWRRRTRELEAQATAPFGADPSTFATVAAARSELALLREALGPAETALAQQRAEAQARLESARVAVERAWSRAGWLAAEIGRIQDARSRLAYAPDLHWRDAPGSQDDPAPLLAELGDLLGWDPDAGSPYR